MGLADGAAWEKENEFWINKEKEDKKKNFYLELRNNIAEIKNIIWNNDVDVIFNNYDYALYKEESIEECFILFQIALLELKKYKGICMSGEEIYSNYKHFFEEHLKLYPNKLEFTNKIYIE